MKIMISQPMRGKTTEEINKERAELVTALEDAGHEVLDTVHEDYPTELAERKNSIPVWYLGKSIKFMSNADCVYFMEGWQDARGCIIEHEVAIAYGLKVMYDNDYKFL